LTFSTRIRFFPVRPGVGAPSSLLQEFDSDATPRQGPPRLARLRKAMSDSGVAGFLVPRSDAFQGEWVAPCDRRLEWLTGFTGSAGLCIALSRRAAIFVDSRYRIQARLQVDRTEFETREAGKKSSGVSQWLAANLTAGSVVGYDAWLHTRKEISALRSEIESEDIELRAIDNLVDRIWDDRPPRPARTVAPYPLEFSGEPHESKRSRIARSALGSELSAAFIASPESIAWLLNIRGTDIQRTPVAHAYAILNRDGSAELFARPEMFGESALEHLGPDVRIRNFDFLGDFLTSIPGPVLATESTLPDWVSNCLESAGIKLVFGPDPCEEPKAIRNAVETAGVAEAHLRDGTAMVEFLAWLHSAASDGITEIDAVRKLERCRVDTGALQDISFETIAASGPNGAIVHYKVTKHSNRMLRRGELLLLDSGGQYLDGTTDVTRTVGLGEIKPELREIYTRVLKGLIWVSRCRWPEGRTGTELDAFARYHLWMAGLDFGHSTGHGVGHFLGVHEGPQQLGGRSRAPIRSGMILSIEPGCYQDFEFGIRIENLAIAKKYSVAERKVGPKMLCFRTLTLVPIDLSIAERAMLTECERTWLNEYHASVLRQIGPRCTSSARAWLHSACRPI